jgi:copper chaperone
MVTQIRIDGMSCGHCVAGVKRALSSVEGVAVHDVRVGAATVSYDPTQVTPEEIAQAVADEGYQAHFPEKSA